MHGAPIQLLIKLCQLCASCHGGCIEPVGGGHWCEPSLSQEVKPIADERLGQQQEQPELTFLFARRVSVVIPFARTG